MTLPPPSGPRPAQPHEAAAVAALHASELTEGFLVSLGVPFLRRLYLRVVRSPGSFVLVTGERERIDGFIAVSERTGRLYREFLLRDGLVAGLAAAPAVLRAPRRTWETFRYGASASAGPDLPPAEVLAVAVASDARGHGLGGALTEAALAELRRRGVCAARVVTASDNASAIRMYERAGFARRHQTEVHSGVVQEVLVWD